MPAQVTSAGLTFSETTFWELSSPRNRTGFVRGLIDALPVGGTLCFECAGVAPAVRSFFAAHPAAIPQPIVANTRWPKPTFFHVPASPENIQAIASLLESHAEPEVCDHFYAYDSEGMLLYWPDAFADSPVLLSFRLPEESIRRLAHESGSTHRQVSGA